ncbi:MAG: nuclear transport factor 2 family protein [Sphingomonas sp.]
MSIARRRFCAGLLAGTAALPIRALAAAAPAGEAARIGALLAGVDRAEGVRAVRRLHYAWAQHAIDGRWDAVGALFAEDGEMLLGDEPVRGRAAIAARLRADLGGGAEGLLPGAVHAQLLMTPVVTLSPGGLEARGRWHEIAMAGRLGGDARWAGGIQENDYVKRGGAWQIARLRYTPQFAGSYAEGWSNVAENLGIVPCHYTPDTAGTPADTLPVPAAPARRPGRALAQAERRIAALEDEDAVRNLQYAYGYYLDRKMWDDVVDLFAAGGRLEIEGLGTWTGPAGIRRALERNGPAGLRHGELNDHVQLDPIVTVSPRGTEARATGIELGMVGRNQQYARWTLATFDNRFVRQDGVWKLAAMRLRPVLRSDYYQGWAKDQTPEPPPPPEFAPDAPARPARVERFPRGRRPEPAGSTADRVAAAEAGLRRAAGVDAVENISSAIGNWLDDFQWAELAALFAADGVRKAPAAGYYIGPDRIRRMQELRNGPLRRPRRAIPMHMRIQPVIHAAADGRSAKLRTRLLQFNSRWGGSGSLTGGMYEDVAVLENGVWRFRSDVINHIWRTPGYKQGWAQVPEGAGEDLAPPPTKLLEAMPPDRPIDGPAFAPFPAIGPLAFHYRNPVSGRAPPDLLP